MMPKTFLIVVAFLLYNMDFISVTNGVPDADISQDITQLNASTHWSKPNSFSNRTQSGKRFVGYNLYMNFLDFIELCHKNGMQPAEVLSAEENAVLTSYLDGNFAAPKYFWLGGADIGREGRYYWIASLTEFRYTSWYPGYPNGGTDENCATIYGGDGTWYDQYCTNDGVQPLCQTND